MNKVDNGYGAVTKFDYDSFVHTHGFAQEKWYVVTDVKTWDGLQYVYGVDFSSFSTTSYDRDSANACYDIDGEGCRSPSFHQSNALVGYDSVIITQSGVGTLNRQEMTFNVNNYWLNGRTTNITTTVATDPNTILAWSKYTWVEDNNYAEMTQRDDYRYDPVTQSEVIHTKQVST